MGEVDKIEAGLDNLRNALKNDGADITLISVNEDSIVLRLEILPGACEDCLLPLSHLKNIFNAALEQVANGRSIKIIDFREENA